MNIVGRIFRYFIDHLCGRHSDLRTFAINFPASYIVPFILLTVGTTIMEMEVFADYESWQSYLAELILVPFMMVVEFFGLLITPVWGAVGTAARFIRRLIFILQSASTVSLATLPLIGFMALAYNIVVFFIFPGEFLLAATGGYYLFELFPALGEYYSQVSMWAWEKANELLGEIGKFIGDENLILG